MPEPCQIVFVHFFLEVKQCICVRAVYKQPTCLVFLFCSKNNTARKADLDSRGVIPNVPIPMKRSHFQSTTLEPPLKMPFGTAIACTMHLRVRVV